MRAEALPRYYPVPGEPAEEPFTYAADIYSGYNPLPLESLKPSLLDRFPASLSIFPHSHHLRMWVDPGLPKGLLLSTTMATMARSILLTPAAMRLRTYFVTDR